MEISFAVIVAVVVGLVESLKKIGLPTKWCPLAAVVLGVGLNLLSNAANLVLWQNVIGGLVCGLSSMGLYDLSSPPVEAVAKKLRSG